MSQLGSRRAEGREHDGGDSDARAAASPASRGCREDAQPVARRQDDGDPEGACEVGMSRSRVDGDEEPAGALDQRDSVVRVGPSNGVDDRVEIRGRLRPRASRPTGRVGGACGRTRACGRGRGDRTRWASASASSGSGSQPVSKGLTAATTTPRADERAGQPAGEPGLAHAGAGAADEHRGHARVVVRGVEGVNRRWAERGFRADSFL